MVQSRLVVLVASVAAILIGAVAYRHYRFRLLGDVHDADGRPLQSCSVELLRRWRPLADWSVYIARKSITNPSGTFAFDVLSVPGGTFRLRVLHAGYQEWLIEAPASSVPKRVHVSLCRNGEVLRTTQPNGG
jgi:hypothetical protein